MVLRWVVGGWLVVVGGECLVIEVDGWSGVVSCCVNGWCRVGFVVSGRCGCGDEVRVPERVWARVWWCFWRPCRGVV